MNKRLKERSRSRSRSRERKQMTWQVVVMDEDEVEEEVSTQQQRERPDVANRLPDEMLLRLFSLLPPEALLAAGRVCRRWRALHADERLWGAHTIAHDRGPKSHALFMRALAVAPRLAEVHFVDFERADNEEMGNANAKRALHAVRALLRSPCKVHLLLLSFRFLTEHTLELETGAENLLRVEKLVVWGNPRMRSKCINSATWSFLDLVAARDLEFVDVDDALSYHQVAGRAVCGHGLQRLRYSSLMYPFLCSLIRKHRRTLQVVQAPQEARAAVVEELASCRALSELHMTCTGNLELLNALELLERLHLYGSEHRFRFLEVPAAVRHLTLWCPVGAVLVAALTRLANAKALDRLQTLAVFHNHARPYECPRSLKEVRSVVPKNVTVSCYACS